MRAACTPQTRTYASIPPRDPSSNTLSADSQSSTSSNASSPSSEPTKQRSSAQGFPRLTPKQAQQLPDLPPEDPLELRAPRAVQAVYLKPLRRHAQYGVPSCDLQLRSYSVRNLEFFTDFCLRAAYYLGLPAYGPVPLPRITERWTVPLGHFIHKKSQENFERKTLRRLIQIKDGEPETVEVWLAFLRKHAYHGIGMKANVWAFDKLGLFLPFPSQWDRIWTWG